MSPTLGRIAQGHLPVSRPATEQRFWADNEHVRRCAVSAHLGCVTNLGREPKEAFLGEGLLRWHWLRSSGHNRFST
jgi:hypothetical protein